MPEPGGFELDVEATGLQELIEGFEGMPEDLEGRIKEWLPLAGEVVVAIERQMMASLFKQPKGLTAASVRAVVQGLEVSVGPTTPYAAFVNNGTAAHVIEPTDPNGFLRFMVDGRVVYAKRVQHPGFAGHHYAEKTAEAAAAPITDLLASILGRAA